MAGRVPQSGNIRYSFGNTGQFTREKASKTRFGHVDPKTTEYQPSQSQSVIPSSIGRPTQHIRIAHQNNVPQYLQAAPVPLIPGTATTYPIFIQVGSGIDHMTPTEQAVSPFSKLTNRVNNTNKESKIDKLQKALIAYNDTTCSFNIGNKHLKGVYSVEPQISSKQNLIVRSFVSQTCEVQDFSDYPELEELKSMSIIIELEMDDINPNIKFGPYDKSVNDIKKLLKKEAKRKQSEGQVSQLSGLQEREPKIQLVVTGLFPIEEATSTKEEPLFAETIEAANVLKMPIGCKENDVQYIYLPLDGPTTKVVPLQNEASDSESDEDTKTKVVREITPISDTLVACEKGSCIPIATSKTSEEFKTSQLIYSQNDAVKAGIKKDCPLNVFCILAVPVWNFDSHATDQTPTLVEELLQHNDELKKNLDEVKNKGALMQKKLQLSFEKIQNVEKIADGINNFIEILQAYIASRALGDIRDLELYKKDYSTHKKSCTDVKALLSAICNELSTLVTRKPEQQSESVMNLPGEIQMALGGEQATGGNVSGDGVAYQSLIPKEEPSSIVGGLTQIRIDISSPTFTFNADSMSTNKTDKIQKELNEKLFKLLCDLVEVGLLKTGKEKQDQSSDSSDIEVFSDEMLKKLKVTQ